MAFKAAFLVPLLTFTIPNVISWGMPGGLTPQNPSDPSYMEKAWQASKDVNEGASNSPYMMVPIKVVQAQTQVVAGVKYNMDVLYGDSTCRRGAIAASAVSAANCHLMPNGNRALYNVQSYSRPWENFEQFTVTKIRDVAPDPLGTFKHPKERKSTLQCIGINMAWCKYAEGKCNGREYGTLSNDLLEIFKNLLLTHRKEQGDSLRIWQESQKEGAGQEYLEAKRAPRRSVKEAKEAI